MENQFLIKDGMADMKKLLSSEIDELKGDSPIYAGVQLLGYHKKGDTPAPIIYQHVDRFKDTLILDRRMAEV